MTDKTPFYITTAISYPNGKPHIGHAYELIATDAMARFQRLDGMDVFFLTGTDEHGQKMQQTARAEGISPEELAQRNSDQFREMGKLLNASNDDFIRTTEERHHETSRNIWNLMADSGDIYKDSYAGFGIPCATRPITPRTRRKYAPMVSATGRRARRSNGWKRKASSSSSPNIRINS